MLDKYYTPLPGARAIHLNYVISTVAHYKYNEYFFYKKSVWTTYQHLFSIGVFVCCKNKVYVQKLKLKNNSLENLKYRYINRERNTVLKMKEI
jgi:hypothetical protein